MPTYDYKCNVCGVITEEPRRVRDMDAPFECPACGSVDTTRLWPVFKGPINGNGAVKRPEWHEANLEAMHAERANEK